MNTQLSFGIRVPAFPVDGSQGKIFRNQITNYLAALQGSYNTLWVADHFVPWHEDVNPAVDTLEAWTTMAYLAGNFPEMMIGSIVLSQSYRSPALLAKMAATFQVLTGGRLIFGLGAGWKEDEYLAYGYDYPTAATRIHQLAEAARIVRLMWTEPKATYHGQYYRVEGAICEPKPDPVPPLLIGGGGRKLTLRVVAEQADWWNFPGGSLENYSELLDVLREHCRQVGRDYDSIVKSWATECVAVSKTREEAQRLAQASPFGIWKPVIGTPEEVAAYLQRFVDLGVRHFILRFADFPRPDGTLLFANEVIPQLS